jgi:hypothetical protein
LGEGSDLEIGGAGSMPGQFLTLRDMAFDGQNNLYTLEGFDQDPLTGVITGNGRVQKFDAAGNFLDVFSLRNDAMGANALGDKNDPQRLAVTSDGTIYVTQPKADLVQKFDSSGRFVRSFAVPQAMAITTWTVAGREQIAVIGSRRDQIPSTRAWQWIGGDKIFTIHLNDTTEAPLVAEPAAEWRGRHHSR